MRPLPRFKQDEELRLATRLFYWRVARDTRLIQGSGVYAETVQIDGGTAALVLIVLIVFLFAVAATIWLGFFCAVRAGRGSRFALAGWVVIAAGEGYIAVLGWGNALFWVGMSIVLLQAVAFGVTRGSRRDS